MEGRQYGRFGCTSYFTGNQHRQVGKVNRLFDDTEKKAWIYENMTGLNGLQIDDFHFSPANKDIPATSFRVKASSNKPATQTGKRLMLMPNLLNRQSVAPEAMEKRTQELVLRHDFLDIDSILIQLPQGYTIESMPAEPVLIQNEFGEYYMHYKLLSGNQLEYVRRRKQFKKTFAPEMYKAYRNYVLDIIKWDKSQLVLVKEEE